MTRYKDQSLHTCWYTDRQCPHCGNQRATNGRTVWCTNPECDAPEYPFDDYIKEKL